MITEVDTGEQDGGQTSFWNRDMGSSTEEDAAEEDDAEISRPDLPVIGDDAGGGEMTCGLEDELSPNQSASTAFDAGTDYRQDNLYICPGTSDWFKFEAEAGQTIFVYAEFDGQFGDLDMYLYREGESGTRDAAVATSTNPNQSEFISFEVPIDGVYLVELASYEFSQNQYLMFIKVGCGSDQDCPDGTSCFLRGGYCDGPVALTCGQDEGFEPNESSTAATPLTPIDGVVELEGMNICPEDTDYYRLELSETAIVTATLAVSDGNNVDLFLFEDGGRFVAQGQEIAEGGRALNGGYLSAGSYIVLVDQTQDQLDPRTYDLRIELEVGRCTEDEMCSGVFGREFCDLETGGCQGIESEGGQALGEPCDDDGDCVENSAGCYEGSQGGGDNICTVLCTVDQDCAAGFGEGSYCLLLDPRNDLSICVNPCEEDFDCSSDRYCVEESNRCESRQCFSDADCQRPGEACLYDDSPGFPGQGGLCQDYEESQSQTCGIGEGPDEGDNGSSSRASLLSFEGGDELSASGLLICVEDEDWYVVEVVRDSQLLGVSLSFEGAADLDLYLFNEAGVVVDESIEPDGNPEEVSGRYLSAGRYYLRVNHYPSEGSPAEVSYNLSVLTDGDDCRTEGSGCAGTRPLRILCSEESGACQGFEGEGEVALGETCDSNDDCTEGADLCWTFNGGNGANICTHFCQRGEGCEDVPGTECQPIQRGVGICLPPQ